MVKLFRPDVSTSQSGAGVSESLAATSGSGLAAIGSAVNAAGRAVQQLDPGAGARQVGKLVEAESKKYFDETKRAHQSAMLSNSMNEATLEFMKAQQQRVAQVQDDKGNPTFMSLTDDIGKLGTDVSSRVAKNISDSEVSAIFKRKFQDFTANQQVLSLKTARSQQVGFSRASLDKGLAGTLAQGTSDDLSNLESYVGQGQQQLNAALSTGAISPQEHQQRTQRFTETIRGKSYQNVIDQDSESAKVLLSQDAEALGISEDTKGQLNRTLDAKIKSDEIAAKKAAATLDRDQKNNQALLSQDLELKMETDSLREDELLKAEPALDPSSYKLLKAKFVKETKKHVKLNKAMDNISTLISGGRSTDGVSPKQVDEHYKRVTESQQLAMGQAPTLPQKAQIAAAYQGKVRGFAKEVSQSLLSGTPESAAQAVSAYTYIRDRKSRALDGNIFTNKAEAVAEYAELLNERGGVALEEAVLTAKEAVMNAGEPVQKERAKQFRKIKDFKIDRLEATTADDLDAENFFGVNKAVSRDAQLTYRRFAEEAFIATGDEDAARKIAKAQMDKTHGVSSFNGDDEYMFSPPEQMYPNLPVDVMRNQMREDLVPIMPEGVAPEDAKLFSDAVTRGNFITIKNKETGQTKKVELVSYGVQYKREVADGVFTTVPLVDPKTGELVRWFPDEGKVLQTAQDKKDVERAGKLKEATQEDAALRKEEAEKKRIAELYHGRSFD